MQLKTPLTLSALLPLVLLTGCSSQTLTEKSMESVGALRAEVMQAGISCNTEKTFKTPDVKEALSCGDNVWLTVYQDESQKDARTTEYDAKKNHYVEGPNWTVVGPQEQLDKLSS
ncbi:hypothetical protein [Kocuria rhizophila]|uniref:hypothetical protein n=1 Tax=Kocuria rhizophila TaxID=72000 RepID=UPI003D700420